MASSHMGSRARGVEQTVRAAFDRRHGLGYRYECHIGSGAQGDIFRLMRRDRHGEGLLRFIVKIIADELTGVPGRFMDEKDVMTRITPSGPDPLRRILGPSLPDNQWMYMEYVENGTLQTFLNKVASRGGRLPNRIMWKIYMCFVRIGIAFAWPDVHTPGPVVVETIHPDTPPRMLLNTDLHAENMMFGKMDDNLEHSLVPIMKNIDLGCVQEVPTPDEATWDRAMKSFVAGVGLELMILQQMEKVAELGRGNIHHPGIDPDLRNAILLSRSSNQSEVPDLLGLAGGVSRAVYERDANWYYQNMPDHEPQHEKDDAIELIIRVCLLDAPAAPEVSTDSGRRSRSRSRRSSRSVARPGSPPRRSWSEVRAQLLPYM
ncbi:putative Protein kinase domain-containing protein [Seiridium cardinale]